MEGMEGTLHEKDGRYVLRFERRLDHAPEKAWAAITDPQRLRAWFPQGVEYEGEMAVGEKIRFHWDKGDDEPPFGGEILAFDPPRLFEFTWDDEVLRFELRPDGGGGCVLVFTDTMDDRGRAARNASGWHACLDALAAWLDGRALGSSSQERSAGLREGYARSFA
jgi:uncharacterized protein YndB with AHSA1/START domain